MKRTPASKSRRHEVDERPLLSRSEIMARVKSRDTGAEMIVRRAMHKAGLRFRLNRKSLPGKPDIVFPSRRLVVFVHGCFWHQHTGCRRAKRPTSNSPYWQKKLDRNVNRDCQTRIQLERLGWRSLVIWECEIHRTTLLNDLIDSVKKSPSACRHDDHFHH